MSAVLATFPLVATGALASCGSSTGSGTVDSGGVATADSSRRLPDVLLASLDGEAIPMRSLIGTPLVVNFWYTTCPPCGRELPVLAAAAAKYAGRVSFVGIDPRDDASAVTAFVAPRGVAYRQLLDRTDASTDALGLAGFPTTMLVGADGTIRAVIRHAVTADELDSRIRKTLLP